MNVRIPVADREEGEQIRRGLEDPETRAFVRVVGTLVALPSDRARARVLGYVADVLDEERG